MKNLIVINADGEQLVSSIHDNTNRLFINGTEINNSLWIGTGQYITTVENHEITINKIADLNGNIILVKNSDYHYSLLKSSTGGGSGGVTSYNDLTDKPSIEGVTLIGDKTHEDLNLSGLTNEEIDEICPWEGIDEASISYDALKHRPSIEGVVLTGNKTLEDLNIQRITNSELEDLLTL